MQTELDPSDTRELHIHWVVQPAKQDLAATLAETQALIQKGLAIMPWETLQEGVVPAVVPGSPPLHYHSHHHSH